MLTIDEAMAELGIKSRTKFNRVAASIPHYLIGKKKFYQKRDLETYLEENRILPCPLDDLMTGSTINTTSRYAPRDGASDLEAALANARKLALMKSKEYSRNGNVNG